MDEEGLLSLENRISNLEKSLGILEEEPVAKVKFETKAPPSLISKISFVDHKIKEIYMSQIQNLIEKETNLKFLIKNSDNITQVYDLIKQKLKIILDNSEFLDKTSNHLKQINQYKQFIDSSLANILNENFEEIGNVLKDNERVQEEFIEFQNKYKRILQMNGDIINDLNSYVISLDYIISEKEPKKN